MFEYLGVTSISYSESFQKKKYIHIYVYIQQNVSNCRIKERDSRVNCTILSAFPYI